ncbi:MAG: hypothetical protein FWF85_04545, partial [Clostridiales bacterium]|nr:hypothetical protein [Clostridiales bacterium]
YEKFGDDKVHFRMETVIQNEGDCDPEGQGRLESDIVVTGDKILLEKFKIRQAFLAKSDARYERFWADFNGTTEQASLSKDGLNASVMPYDRVVFDPNNEEHRQFINGRAKEDEDGFVISVEDCFKRRTDRRVCPKCHNPLPGTYGKNPVKFISVIGITGAGKTVYLSQLCNHFKTFASRVGITAVPTSKGALEFIFSNVVSMGEPLPEGSPPEKLTQPIFYDLILKKRDQIISNTIVIYDIAGENCVDPEKMNSFGHFVEHADGIILLIDPVQFDIKDKYQGAADPVTVLDAIYNRFTSKSKNDSRNMPLAVCISKGDTVSQNITGRNMADVQYVQDEQKLFLPLFNAADYNDLQISLKDFIDENENVLRTHLRNQFDNYNYFLFSSIGASTQKGEKDGKQYDAPAAPPIPKRIEEPVFWLFHKFNYIGKNGEINAPEPPPVETWTCIKGHEGNTGERCDICGRDQSGKKPGLLERLRHK